MEPLYIRLNNEQCTLKVKIRAKNAVIRLTGEDHDRQYTVYFDRTQGSKAKPFTGEKTFSIPMPVSPEILEMQIIAYAGEFKVLNVELDYLATRDLVITERTRKFVEYAIEFCKNAGTLEAGTYFSKDEEIVIGYSDNIRNRNTGQILSTPARVSRLSGVMEANRMKFREYTIPMRLLILLHERMHYDFNTRDEVEADLNALRIYLAYGFPQTEAIYATAKLFYDRPEMIDRVKHIISFIKDFDSTIKRRAA